MEKLGRDEDECMHAYQASRWDYNFFSSVFLSFYRAYQDGVLSGDDAVGCFTGLHIIQWLGWLSVFY